MSETWHDSGAMDRHDAQDALGDAWARDRRAVIDKMAREICPTQWREGGSMRYRGHTITWGEYVTRRHEIEDEKEFTVETWREREFNPTTSSLTDYQARGAALDTGLCSDGYPCGESVAFGERYCDDCPNRNPADDAVNHPAHYTSGGVECIDALAAATVNKRGIEAICTANVIKYLWRYENKGGAEDVRKARWYIERLLAVLEGEL